MVEQVLGKQKKRMVLIFDSEASIYGDWCSSNLETITGRAKILFSKEYNVRGVNITTHDVVRGEP